MLRERIDRRIGNIVRWSAADKCLLAAALCLVFAISYIALLYAILVTPGIAPYVDRAFLARYLSIAGVAYVGTWLIIIVAALALRHRSPDNSALVHATCQLYAIEFGFAAYFLGSHTTAFVGVISLSGAAFGLALFEPRPVWLGIVSFIAVVTGTTFAEQLGLLPYAPLLAEAPFKNGHLATSWLVTLGGLTFVLMLCQLGLIAYVIDRWHRHEDQLVQTTDQLARANDLISRYVAAQVAEQIRLGNYDAVDRQDRRRLTLFFSDIKGFTEVADHVEPEELSEILNEYFAEMTIIADGYGATIDKFMGDAMMVFFGAPVATHDRDHAVRAVRMAMGMQTRMAALQHRWQERGILEPFQVRIGINTGVASVGNFGTPGRMDYTAIGRQVNLAARLQVSCEPGKVLLAHSTWVLVRDEIDCVPKGEIQVKGIRDPVMVYEVSDSRPVAESSAQSTQSGAAA
jgi:class 3 adenylate cyclase